MVLAGNNGLLVNLAIAVFLYFTCFLSFTGILDSTVFLGFYWFSGLNMGNSKFLMWNMIFLVIPPPFPYPTNHFADGKNTVFGLQQQHSNF